MIQRGGRRAGDKRDIILKFNTYNRNRAMQGKKIILVVFGVLLIAAGVLTFMPLRRTYQAEIVVNADKLITCRTLQDTDNWKVWYRDGAITQPNPVALDTQSMKKGTLFEYRIGNDDYLVKDGRIEITAKNRWDLNLKWAEDYIVKGNIFRKLQLLFKPSAFRAEFLQNIVEFKNAIEHPGSTFGGLTFKPLEMPAVKWATLTDTVDLQEVNAEIPLMHDRLIRNLPGEMIKSRDSFLSRYEILPDSSLLLTVAVTVEDNLVNVKEPLEMIEMDEHPVVILHSKRSYTDMNEDINIMYEWLKKTDQRPANSYWVKHNVSGALAKTRDNNDFTIIQEVYSLK